MATTLLAALASRTRRVVAGANGAITGDSLSSKVVRNAGWLTIGYGAEIVIRFFSSLILTRLLDPGAYGLITTVSVFLTIAVMLSDLGIRTIVQTDARGDDKAFLGILWTIQVIRGFLLAAALGLVAWVWHLAQVLDWLSPASMYRDPLLPQMLFLVGTSLVVRGFSSINEYRLLRDLNRGAVSRMDILARIATTIVTVLLVFFWRSVWAMALALVIGTAIRTLMTLVMLAGPRMTLRYNRADFRDVLLHSRWVALSSALTVITMSADKIVIGAYFDLQILGIYSLAFSLFSSANTIVEQMNVGMGVPVLRAIADKSPAERIRAFYRFRMPIELYCVVGGVGMVVFGPLFFQIAYDPRYHLGGTMLALLGIKLILTPISFSGNFLLAIQRFKLVSIITGVRSVVFLLGLGLATWLQSVELVVLVVALERLPEILIFMILPHDSVPFHWKRDGGLIVLASALLLYLFI